MKIKAQPKRAEVRLTSDSRFSELPDSVRLRLALLYARAVELFEEYDRVEEAAYLTMGISRNVGCSDDEMGHATEVLGAARCFAVPNMVAGGYNGSPETYWPATAWPIDFRS